MNSRCIRAQRNAKVFPHPVYLVSTILTRVYIVDQLDDAGLPAHAIRYALTERDSKLINAHDRHGVGIDGELRLRIPDDPKGSPKRRQYDGGFAEGGGRYSGDGKSKGVMRRPITHNALGARARYLVAVGAGLNLDDDDKGEEQ
jgi:hypothetical protein